MTVSYQQVAEARPRVGRDVLYTQTTRGVLFHNSQAGFQLTSKSAYRFACALIPHLTGEQSVAQLCEGLDQGQRAMVAELVSVLLDRGFARDAGPEQAAGVRAPAQVAGQFAAQINYVDHYAGNAHARFLRYRASRVAVLGSSDMARWCVLSLIRNGAAAVGVQPSVQSPDNAFGEITAEAAQLAAAGCPVELIPVADAQAGWPDLAGFDVVVVTAGPRQLTALLSAGIPAGVRVLPASVFGGHALVGPLMSAGRAGCWVCAALRFGANRAAGPAADVWSELIVPPPGTGQAPSRPLSAMLGNLLAYEVFRLTTGALPAETDGHVIVQDLDSMDCLTEPLLAHPRCPFCREAAGDGAGDDTGSAGGDLPRSPATATAADADRGDEMLDELTRRSLLVRPTMGVFTAWDDDAVTQLPLKVGRVRVGIGHAVRRTISAFDVHHVVGARLSALYRAAEVYAEHVVPVPPVPPGSSGGLPRVDPDALAIASGMTAAAPPGTGWVEATSLVSAEKFLVPAVAVRPFGAANRGGACLATSAGSGAGRSVPEALGRALGTALGHDALRRALARERAVTRARLDGLDRDPELSFLASSARHLGLDIELLDLSRPGAAARVLLARAVDEAAGQPAWAMGCDTAWQRAARDALCDLIGRVQLGRELPGQPVDTGDPLIRALDPYALHVDADAAADVGAAASWSAALNDLRHSGRDALAVPADSCDLRRAGISVVRVLLLGRD